MNLCTLISRPSSLAILGLFSFASAALAADGAASTPAAPATEAKAAAPAEASAPAASATPPAAAAAPAPDNSELIATKEKLAQAQAELETVLRTYSLLKEDFDKVSAEAAKVQEAVRQAEAAKAELARLAPQLSDLARLREIVRHTQDTNAALAAENARLKSQLAQQPRR